MHTLCNKAKPIYKLFVEIAEGHCGMILESKRTLKYLQILYVPICFLMLTIPISKNKFWAYILNNIGISLLIL